MVTSPSIRSLSSKSVSATFWPPSDFSITMALNVGMMRPLRCRRGHARHRLLDDRQIDQSGDHPERDRSPPDDVVGAGALIQQPAEPDAEETAHLVAEESQPSEHGQPAGAEHDRDNAV